MITDSFIRAQSAESLAKKRTTPFLRRLVAQVIDQAASEHYGLSYSMRCQQASQAARNLLANMGVEGKVCLGAFCAPAIYEDHRYAGWGGFWGADHHAWAMTQFFEIIDLSIAKTHLHPRNSRADGIAMPAIWWDDASFPPSVIRYLPDTTFKSAAFEDEKATEDFAVFEKRVADVFQRTLSSKQVNEVIFEPVIENISSMQLLHNKGNPWLNRALIFQQRNIPFPDWIVEREAELIAAHAKGMRAPSRLEGATFTISSAT